MNNKENLIGLWKDPLDLVMLAFAQNPILWEKLFDMNNQSGVTPGESLFFIDVPEFYCLPLNPLVSFCIWGVLNGFSESFSVKTREEGLDLSMSASDRFDLGMKSEMFGIMLANQRQSSACLNGMWGNK